MNAWIKRGVCVYIHICIYTHTHTHTHTHNGILFSHKKEETLPFVTTWMDFEGIMLVEVCQTERRKYHMMSLICEL